MNKPKLLLSWSSGKDSAWTLHRLRLENDYQIVGLVTTINENFARVAMHGVRDELLAAQAAAAGLPLWRVPLPHPCSNEVYEARMRALIERALQTGVTHMAFGDLFLQDIRAYREKQLRDTGIAPVFPLWNSDTTQLARDMIAGGLRARITCVDPKQLDPSFAGVEWHAALGRLPPAADPCGENGEFHTFCYAGPMFDSPVALHAGEVVNRDGFIFADFMLESAHTTTEEVA